MEESQTANAISLPSPSMASRELTLVGETLGPIQERRLTRLLTGSRPHGFAERAIRL
jgi:hypothetical protein